MRCSSGDSPRCIGIPSIASSSPRPSSKGSRSSARIHVWWPTTFARSTRARDERWRAQRSTDRPWLAQSVFRNAISAARSSAASFRPNTCPRTARVFTPRGVKPDGSNVSVQPRGIEHLFQAGQRAVVQVPAPIPHAFQRRHLVVAGPLAGLQRQAWDRSRPTPSGCRGS